MPDTAVAAISNNFSPKKLGEVQTARVASQLAGIENSAQQELAARPLSYYEKKMPLIAEASSLGLNQLYQAFQDALDQHADQLIIKDFRTSLPVLSSTAEQYQAAIDARVNGSDASTKEPQLTFTLEELWKDQGFALATMKRIKFSDVSLSAWAELADINIQDSYNRQFEGRSVSGSFIAQAFLLMQQVATDSRAPRGEQIVDQCQKALVLLDDFTSFRQAPADKRGLLNQIIAEDFSGRGHTLNDCWSELIEKFYFAQRELPL